MFLSVFVVLPVFNVYKYASVQIRVRIYAGCVRLHMFMQLCTCVLDLVFVRACLGMYLYECAFLYVLTRAFMHDVCVSQKRRRVHSQLPCLGLPHQPRGIMIILHCYLCRSYMLRQKQGRDFQMFCVHMLLMVLGGCNASRCGGHAGATVGRDAGTGVSPTFKARCSHMCLYFVLSLFVCKLVEVFLIILPLDAYVTILAVDKAQIYACADTTRVSTLSKQKNHTRRFTSTDSCAEFVR